MAKQTKQILISGLASSPSEYLNDDGNLSFAIGSVHEGGSIKPIHTTAPSLVLDISSITLEYGGSVITSTVNHIVLIHKNAGYNHAIIESIPETNDGEYLYSFIDLDKSFSGHIPASNVLCSEYDRFSSIIAVGNNIVAYSNKESFYFFADAVSKTYRFIGNSLPDVDVSFRLSPHSHLNSETPDTSAEFNLVGDASVPNLPFKKYVYGSGEENYNPDEDSNIHYTDESSITTLTNAVFGQLNKFTGGWANDKGYFTQPFFVRYAIRLYDGTLTKHSAPLLMVPANGCNPFVFTRSASLTNAMIDTIGIGCELLYRIENTNLKDWSDIISGIDFFVSQQFYPYDQSRKVVDCSVPFLDKDDNNKVFIYGSAMKSLGEKYSMSVNNNLFEQLCSLRLDDKYDITMGASIKNISSDRRIKDDNDKQIGHGIIGSNGIWFIGNANGTAFNPHSYPIIPLYNEDDYIKSISECSTFYHIKSVDTAMINNNEESFDLKGKINNIVTRKLMTGEFESHHKLIPNSCASYNDRLNIANIRLFPFKGFNIKSILQKVDEDTFFADRFDVFYIIRKKNTEFVTHQHYDYKTDMRMPIQYLYYPDVDAKKAIIFAHINDSVSTTFHTRVREFDLTEHKGLNGAFYFDLLANYDFAGSLNYWKGRSNNDDYLAQLLSRSQLSEEYSSLRNVIYTSEVANPFVFRAANVEQVGSGSVIALCPSAIALSQGQFGQFPMYCFTSEGIWALESNDTGGWKSKQPFSRDVVKSESNILQLDRDIVFSTDRGVMHLSGSNVSCISDIFDNDTDSEAIEVLSRIMTLSGIKSEAEPIDDYTMPFKEFIAHAVYLFDYTHQRIVIGNPSYNMCYIFSLKDKLWTTAPIKVLSAINSYPQCLAEIESNGRKLVVDFCTDGNYEDIAMSNKTVIVTRPITLDERDTLKTISSVVARGDFNTNSVSLALIGSRDLSHWHLVGSSKNSRLVLYHGTPYKYFKIAALCSLGKGESISSFSVVYEAKMNDKLR